MDLRQMFESGRDMLVRLNAFLADNPLEDPALLALAFCYNPFDFSWLGAMTL